MAVRLPFPWVLVTRALEVAFPWLLVRPRAAILAVLLRSPVAPAVAAVMWKCGLVTAVQVPVARCGCIAVAALLARAVPFSWPPPMRPSVAIAAGDDVLIIRSAYCFSRSSRSFASASLLFSIIVFI